MGYINPVKTSGSIEMFEGWLRSSICLYKRWCRLEVLIKIIRRLLYLMLQKREWKVVVATYKNNEIKPFVFPNVIEQVCKGYNHAHILTEVNDIGQQIVEALQFEIEYDNLLMTTQKGVERVKF